MQNKIYFLVSLLLATTPLAAQSIAPWQNAPLTPPPSNMYNYTYGIQLPATDAIWVWIYSNAGLQRYSDLLYSSSDNGSTWQYYYQPYSLNSNNTFGKGITTFYSLNAQQAWVVESTYSLNQATTYSLGYTATGAGGFTTLGPVPGTPKSIAFFTPTTGILLTELSSNKIIYRTTNGGQTWQPSTFSNLVPATWNSPYKEVLGSHIWLTQDGLLLHSADAGLTWTSTTLPRDLIQLTFRDAQHGLAYSNDTGRSLYRTADGGITWVLLSPTGPRGTTNMVAIPGSAGTYISTGISTIASTRVGSAISSDEGQTWQALESTTSLTALAANASQQVWGSIAFGTSGTNMTMRLASTVLASVIPPVATGVAYPNPTTGRVQLPAAGPYQQAQVYDMAGRHCRTVPLASTETTIDLGTYGAGLYVLRLTGRMAAPLNQRLTVLP